MESILLKYSDNILQLPKRLLVQIIEEKLEILETNPTPGGGVNGKPAYCISYILEEMTKFAKNIYVPVIENVIVLGFLLVNTSSKQ